MSEDVKLDFRPKSVGGPGGPSHCIARQTLHLDKVTNAWRAQLSNSDAFARQLARSVPATGGHGAATLKFTPEAGIAIVEIEAYTSCPALTMGPALGLWPGFRGMLAALAGTATYLLIAVAVPAALDVAFPGLALNPWMIGVAGCLGGATATLVSDTILGQSGIANRVNEAMQCILGAAVSLSFAKLADAVKALVGRVGNFSQWALGRLTGQLRGWIGGALDGNWWNNYMGELAVQLGERAAQGLGGGYCSLHRYGGTYICGYGAEYYHFRGRNLEQVFIIGTDYGVWTRYGGLNYLTAGWARLGAIGDAIPDRTIRRSYDPADLRAYTQCGELVVSIVSTDGVTYYNSRVKTYIGQNFAGWWSGWRTYPTVPC